MSQMLKVCCDPFSLPSHKVRKNSKPLTLRKVTAAHHNKLIALGIEPKSNYICDSCRIRLTKGSKHDQIKATPKKYPKEIPTLVPRKIVKSVDNEIQIIYDKDIKKYDHRMSENSNLNSSMNYSVTEKPNVNSSMNRSVTEKANLNSSTNYSATENSNINSSTNYSAKVVNNTPVSRIKQTMQIDEEVLPSLNHILTKFGKRPIEKRKMQLKNYGKQKCKDIIEVLERDVFNTHNTDTDDAIKRKYNNLLNNLKRAYKETGDEHLKLAILTLFPDWTYPEIQEHFDTSERFITVAKKIQAEKGFLCSLGDDIDIITDHNVTINDMPEPAVIVQEPTLKINSIQNKDIRIECHPPNYFLTKEVTIRPLFT